MSNPAKRIFISYSHDSDAHAERVLQLSERLRKDGYDSQIDQYINGTPREGWPRWMLNQIDDADFVLVVCTETYYRRFRGHERPDRGKGVDWEGAVITQEVYDQRSQGLRAVPLLFDATDDTNIPEPLRGETHYQPLSRAGYNSLCAYLDGAAGVEPGSIGPRATRTRRGAMPLSFADDAPSPPQAGAVTAPGRIARSRLLDLGVADRFDQLLGRKRELRLLTDAWRNAHRPILVFVAEGGVGKTSLVTDWMTGFVNKDWDGVDAFFDWSFYSQGSREQSAAHSGQFFDAALRHFGEAGLADSPAPTEAKADRLAQRLTESRSLLLLDGVEPLQHPRKHAGLEGRLKDPGLERLLKQLAQQPGAGGLCVVTTRVPLVDLKRFHDRGVKEVNLDNLSPQAAAQLLHQAGATRAGAAAIQVDDAELLAAARELHGHALAVQLLGGYLRHAHGGDIRRRGLIDWGQALNEQQEGHAVSVMRAYERWFEQHDETGRRQLAALRLLGLFDRPAAMASLDALRGGEPIAGLTEPLAGLTPAQWRATLAQLADGHRLLSLRRAGAGGIAQVDAHPLLREYFAAGLRQERPEAWREGHRRIFEQLCASVEQRPDGLEGLQPLYQAVAHGCLAGLHQRVREDVYVGRILRGTGDDGFYSTRKLGAFGADLGAVAAFFERPWERVSTELSAPDQAWLLNQAAFRLRGLGRLGEALAPMRAGLVMAIEQEDWEQAAIRAGNLSELELSLGDIATAIADAARAVGFADRSEDGFLRIVMRTTHADALRQAGQADQAAQAGGLFEQAEALQAERQPDYPRLYSLSGFWYCGRLLAGAEDAAWRRMADPGARGPDPAPLIDACDQVSERATAALAIAKHNNWLLDIALDRLTLGRAALYRALLAGPPVTRHSDPSTGGDTGRPQAPQPSGEPLDAAVDGLRRSGSMNHLPRGLLTRAWQRRLSGDRADTITDLDEAWELAERGPMPLFQADILLTRARLFGPGPSANTPAPTRSYPWQSARDDLREARRLIDQHGYHRRDQQLADAEAALGG